MPDETADCATDGAAEDAELIARIAAGDQSALRELMDRHSAWLRLRLARRTPDEDLAESALQATFVAVWRHPRRYRGHGAVGAWLWGIAIRQLISALRVRRPPTPVPHQLVSAFSPIVRSAEDELLLAVEHGDLGTALTRLSPQLREALLVTVVDGLSVREAALLLGIPVGTAKSRIRLAKAQLRRHLVGEMA